MQLCLATKAESAMALPGDEIIEPAMINSTHAISIDASPDRVWPWIIQMGQDRGGFYSYTMLENLLGCKMKNANRIHSEWQKLSVGDAIQIHPRFAPLKVEQLISNSHLLLSQDVKFFWTWAFALISENDGLGCRLLVRTRMSRIRWPLRAVLYPVMTAGHYFMERKMLCGIKQRVEDASIGTG
jgi:hypothetical protein